MEKTIRVTGKGCLSIAPDTIRLIITSEAVEPDYAAALSASAESSAVLKALIGECGFEKEELKTLSLDVNAEYKSYLDKETDTWENRFVGYRYTHRLKLEFPLDNEKLGTLLGALSACELHPSFDVEHTVRDPEAVRNMLLAKAVEDSAAKAKILASAAGVRLGSIVLIDYSRNSADISIHPMNACFDAQNGTAARKASLAVDITPNDIDLDDSVTVVWEIE